MSDLVGEHLDRNGGRFDADELRKEVAETLDNHERNVRAAAAAEFREHAAWVKKFFFEGESRKKVTPEMMHDYLNEWADECQGNSP